MRNPVPGLGDLLVTIAKFLHICLLRAWASAYIFAVIFISLIISKCFRIFAYWESLSLWGLLFWGSTFFLAEFLFIVVACFLTRSFESRVWQNVAAVVTALFALAVSSMTAANISYYIHVGVEIHWHKLQKFRNPAPSAGLVLSALAVAFLVFGLILASAYFAKSYLFRFMSALLEMWGSFLPAKVTDRFSSKKPPAQSYEQIALNNSDDDSDRDSIEFLDEPQHEPEHRLPERNHPLFVRIVVTACVVLIIVLRLVRPSDATYTFFSESLPLEVFYTSKYWLGQGSVETLPGDFSWLEERTALDAFPTFEWLQASDGSIGATDWSPFQVNMTRVAEYSNGSVTHYNPLKDPLHTPNLGNDILKSIAGPIRDGTVKIKHVILIKLESTRQDVWPFRADNYVMKRIKESREDGEIPAAMMEALGNLTPNAERLTGWETGFNTKERPAPYGGISASNCFTSGTYTLKSLTGTICGPCFPHILDSLNQRGNLTANSEDWTSWPWHPMWMQSHSATWDYHWKLNPVLGFKDVMTKETIDRTDMKYIPEETEEEEHHGHEDKVLKYYMRDLLAEAKQNKTRLFLAHLTHNTHNPWFTPGERVQYLSDATEGDKLNVNNYINALAYQDQWVGDVLEVFKEAGVADETLFIMVGDHGLSLPNNGGLTANHDSHVTSFHVPLYFSHPKLPQIELTNPVISTQILPTILDLLIQTKSVNEQSLAILGDLLPLYEGQSMIRAPIRNKNGRREWQFTTMNPGGTWISVRSADKPYRLVEHPEQNVDIDALIDAVQAQYGPEPAKWTNEAAHVAHWWIKDTFRRWKYDPENPGSP
ncbi:hypothetical protein N7468_000260 [Penicillium chermesinum]|uniref:Sulfatase N-terminal domain-containing protein n=1 Tax=Penicillium chermesinum TaxID=63820 RepID=A0A9W9TYN6_9EURO|nr:uncharacterized protein N7468_000260 [Penicillium chermesinum]KAJ5248809.1 hypothetical protein N7468_000260 [Penicillium chermesinum]